MACDPRNKFVAKCGTKPLQFAELAADTGGAAGPLDRDTIRDYLTALDRVMVVEDQPAWSPHPRSRSRLRRAPKRHFVDPSLAVAAIGSGLEVDAIVRTRSRRWAAFEVKLGTHRIEDAASALLRSRDRVDPERTGPPAALVVVTGTGYAYTRPDGVSVVPVGTLGP